MNETHFKEIEAVMLYMSEGIKRAQRAEKALTKMKAKPHLIEAVKRAERELAETKRAYFHGTYYAAENYPDETVAEQLPLA